MARNLLETEWVSRWTARDILKRARNHLMEQGEDSEPLLEVLIVELTPATISEPDHRQPSKALGMLWRVHRRLVNAGEVDAALVVLEAVLSFFR